MGNRVIGIWIVYKSKGFVQTQALVDFVSRTNLKVEEKVS